MLKPPYGLSSAEGLPKFDRSVSLVCWGYDEEELIGPFIDRATAMLDGAVQDWELVVVDDGSTDRTNAIVRERQAREPRVRLITHERNLNVGYACMHAIEAASKEFLFWQTVDWSYDLRLLRVFLELLRTHDVVAGVRRAPVGGSALTRPFRGVARLLSPGHLTGRSDTASKALVSISNYLLIRVLFRFPLSDYQNVVFYPTRLIQTVKIEGRGSFVNPELLFKAHRKGASIKEVPIPFLPRERGVAKGTRVSAIVRSVYDVFRLWVRFVVLGRCEFVRRGAIVRLDPAEWDAACLRPDPSRPISSPPLAGPRR